VTGDRPAGTADDAPTRAALLLEAGRPEAAADVLASSLGQTPDDPRALRLMSTACLALDRLPEAWHAAERSVVTEPGSAASHLAMSAVLLRYRKFHEALAAATEATRLEPEWPWAWVRLAETAAGSEIGRRAGEQAVRLAPDDPDAHLALGSAVLVTDPTLAADCFERALALDPSSARARNNLALVRHRGGRVLDGIDGYVGAVRADMSLAVARENVELAIGQVILWSHVALFALVLGGMFVAEPAFPWAFRLLPAAVVALLVGLGLRVDSGKRSAFLRALSSRRSFRLLAIALVPAALVASAAPLLPLPDTVRIVLVLLQQALTGLALVAHRSSGRPR
jgi:tetratricopeptide (TPR) repeat protein